METKDDVQEVIAELVEPKEPRKKMTKAARNELQSQERIQAIEDRLYERSGDIVSHSLDFMEVTFGADREEADRANEALVNRWAQEMGSREAAEQRFRVALYACSKKSEMPGGMAMAQEIFVGITKAKAKTPVVHNELNMNFIKMPQPEVFKILEEDGE